MEVKLLRSHVWLSQRSLDEQDGFLAVARVGKQERLVHGAADPTGATPPASTCASARGRKRKFQRVELKWTEREPGVASFELAMPPQQRNSSDAVTDMPPPLELQLFMLQAQQQTLPERQRIVYIGKSNLQLSARDLDAMQKAHEIVFSTMLEGGLGGLDVKLSTLAAQRKTKELSNEDTEVAARSAFSVNWSSSEALKKDLEEKARLKTESEKKLLLQLNKVVAKATRLVHLRDEELRRRRLWWAAAKIQCAYRALLGYRLEALERVNREQRALAEAKQARVRENVVARNKKRAQAMREQLKHVSTRGSALPPHVHSNHGVSGNGDGRDSSVAVEREIKTLVAQKQSVALAKLQKKLAQLEATRECSGDHRSSSRDNQWRETDTLSDETNSDANGKNHSTFLEQELIHAIQVLHVARHKG